ncbi:MAG: SurA N-terminal domain-containing protein [Pyrinomonadaceae bacterium]
MRQAKFKVSAIALMAFATFIFSACNSGTATGGGSPDTAATVNGKAISMEEVERVIKEQGQGQEAKLSPLELAQARLQVLDQLIQQEVMYQKAEKEGVVPKDDDVTAEFNKTKQTSGLSQEKFDEKMKKAGQTEASAKDTIKKRMAVIALIDKISSKVEPQKDSEIEAFFNGNKDAYVKRKGVKLAAIVIDPSNSGEGDTTVDEQSAVLKGNEILKKLKAGADFAALARENSEDQSRLQGGDLGYISEDQLKQNFPPQVAANLMNPQFPVGQILATPMQGKYYIFKLQERSDRDEAQTLETPGVREDVTNRLIEARKQLLAASYQTIAMDEAKVENFLARHIVDNPNELSGARPADTSANSNANIAAPNTNSATNANSNVNANVKTATGANAKPAANTNAKPPTANAKTNTK